jgi:uncharacterized membrane protein YgcG
MNFRKNCKTHVGLASLFVVTALALGFLSLSRTLPAQSPGPGQPARAVRLSYVDGKVQLTQGGQAIASQAVINAPLFEGTQITTAEDGKTEIQFDDGSVARLSPNSTLTLKTLTGEGSGGDAEMVLEHGLAYFELQGSDQSGQMRVLFADSAVTASGFSVIRVDMDNPPGALAVFSGNAHVERGSGGSLDLHGGETADFNGADAANPDVADAIQPDSWDAWNSDRDSTLNAETSVQSPATSDLAGPNASNPAWSDLDANGNWYNVPGQGYVWSPYDAANPGFDPYGNGAWIGTPGYGYAFASGYSWGYLPYQCGAWNFYNNFGWGWAPGMGGCSPWWGAGFYPGPIFGVIPIGYRPIHRPIGDPVGGPFRGRPQPGRVIAVNRTPLVAHGAFAPRSGPVVLAGHTVQALRPVPTQSSFAHASATTAFHVYPPSAASARSNYVASRPGYIPSPANSLNRTTVAPAPTYTPRPYTPPAPHPYSPPAPRSYSPPPSHPSSGGGGGSVPHSSGGSGGVGGGGGHSGGGGGGGHH